MSIASRSPDHSLETVPPGVAVLSRREGGEITETNTPWTDANNRDVSPSASCLCRLQPGDGLGFQMIRREDDETDFPLFLSPCLNPHAKVPPAPPPRQAQGKALLTATSKETPNLETMPPHNPIESTSKKSVHGEIPATLTSPNQSQDDDKGDPRHDKPAGHSPLECHSCGTCETPEWRRSPDGLHDLCNVCGLVLAKKHRRKLSALTASPDAEVG